MSARLFYLPLVLTILSAHSFAGEAPEKVTEVIRNVYAALSADEEKGFERLGKAKRGTWRAEIDEPPETVEQYKNSARVYPTTERYTIVLQPLEALDIERGTQLEAMREFVAAFFQLPVRIAAPIEIEAETKRLKLERIIQVDRYRTRTQLNAGKILDEVLHPNIPSDAAIYVGITSSDLFYDGTGVHGLASLRGRVAACSFYKFTSSRRTEQNRLAEIRNFCRLLSHEIGHTFGMGHCVFFRCAMNGCNSTLENTSTPLYYCPVCKDKLALNNAIDQTKRLKALEAFYNKYGMKDETAFIRQQLSHLSRD